jgi:hypothetical protein
MSYGNVLSSQRVIINRLVYFIHVKKENYIELNNFQKQFPHVNKLERLYVSINMDHQFTQLLCNIGVSYASYKVVMRPKHLLINLIYLDIVINRKSNNLHFKTLLENKINNQLNINFRVTIVLWGIVFFFQHLLALVFQQKFGKFLDYFFGWSF